MRDPKRIPEVLTVIKEIWEKNPDLRLGQLINNPISKNRIYNVEDSTLVIELQTYYAKFGGKTS